MRIAISGWAGSGKTTVAKALYERLKEELPTLYLFTPTFKEIVAKMGITLEEYEKAAEKDFSIDKAFDEKIKEEFLAHEHVILASWLAVWTVEDVADISIFLHAPLDIRAKRIADRDAISPGIATAYVLDRDYRNAARYKAIYNIDLFDPWNHVDVGLNTKDLSLEDEVETITALIKSKRLI